MALTKIRQEQGVVINDGSTDVDFRVESNGNANMLFVDGGTDKVGIGTSAFVDTSKVQIEGAKALTSGILQGQLNISDSTAVATGAGGGISFSGNYNGTSKTTFGSIEGSKDNGTSGHYGASLVFKTRSNGGANAENMRIDSSGNVLVGKTSANSDTAGFEANASGFTAATRSDGTVFVMDRLVSDGTILEFRKANTTVGSIGVAASNNLYIGSAASDHTGIGFGTNEWTPMRPAGTNSDNQINLGGSTRRFDDIYATNGTIQTSDFNEKQDIAALTSTEMLVAKRISALFKTFRWKDKVAAKGDDARTHTGIIAQDVQAAFTAESLDAGDYSMFISSTWWEHDVDVAAVEADDTVEPAIEAADAYTRTDTYDTEAEAPEGATSKTRMGIRYPELLSFVAAYNEQRFASIEARITALE